MKALKRPSPRPRIDAEPDVTIVATRSELQTYVENTLSDRLRLVLAEDKKTLADPIFVGEVCKRIAKAIVNDLAGHQ